MTKTNLDSLEEDRREVYSIPLALARVLSKNEGLIFYYIQKSPDCSYWDVSDFLYGDQELNTNTLAVQIHRLKEKLPFYGWKLGATSNHAVPSRGRPPVMYRVEKVV